MAHASEKRILVVDDEPDVRNFLATCIEDAGFVVETAHDGEDALEKVNANPPDLMTLDMVMPRKSGIAVIRSLRESERFTNLPVIVITAHAHTDLGSEDIKGFNAFTSGLRPRYTMEKPVTPEKLVKAIADILDVDTDEVGAGGQQSEYDSVVNMVRNSDEDTLARIKDLLNR
ncbi:MAG: response regulator [Desulfobacterales bacterium]|nr:response regulator [Desulfobacterales bacterium]